MTPILLLHGALGSKSQLDPIKQQLESSGRQVYSLNFSGHSGEPFGPSFGIEQFADDVKRFLERHKRSAVDIFGYSMGGYVALWLAHKHPQSVRKIVTLGTKFDWSVESAEKETRKLNPDKILEKIPAFARILETRHAPQNWKDVLAKTAAMMTKLGAQPLLTPEILQEIGNHTMILLGDQDEMADREYSKQVAHLLSNAKFKLLNQTPHPIERVNREELVQILNLHFA
jgi:pimeloyl-ACP methyl ester carboxylesterase